MGYLNIAEFITVVIDKEISYGGYGNIHMENGKSVVGARSRKPLYPMIPRVRIPASPGILVGGVGGGVELMKDIHFSMEARTI